MKEDIREIIEQFTYGNYSIEQATDELFNLHDVINRNINFALWMNKTKYRLKEYSHPSNIGKWWSDYEDTGYLTGEELIHEFLKCDL